MVKGARYVYLTFAWLFVLGVLTQVFFAGMTVVAVELSWEPHITLGHLLAAPLLFMLVSMYLGRLPGNFKRLTWILFGVYILQADILIFLRSDAPVLSAFHPVMALIDFALGWTLARRAWPVAREAQMPARVQPDTDTRTTI